MDRRVFVVYDRNVEWFAEKVCAEHGASASLAIEATEDTKNIDTVMDICRWLLDQGADRKVLVIAVGGGVTTDMVGFAACIYKRGVAFANVPTTLLSQVDAGIGGKTGANLDGYKNIIGVIRQPEFVEISSEPLRTLPEVEFRSGAAEMLKTFIIKDEGNYEKAVKILSQKPSERNQDDFTALIKAAGDVKREVVEIDPYEKGLRKVLNLGHTYAHAIEWYQHTHPCDKPCTHGEAVAIGMVQAALLSEKLGVAKTPLSGKIAADLKACGLPVELPCPAEELEAAMHKDKKAEGDKINFVLIEEIGKVVIKKI